MEASLPAGLTYMACGSALQAYLARLLVWLPLVSTYLLCTTFALLVSGAGGVLTGLHTTSYYISIGLLDDLADNATSYLPTTYYLLNYLTTA